MIWHVYVNYTIYYKPVRWACIWESNEYVGLRRPDWDLMMRCFEACSLRARRHSSGRQLVCPKATTRPPQSSFMRGNLRAEGNNQVANYHSYIWEPNEHVGLLRPNWDLREMIRKQASCQYCYKRILHTPIQMSDQALTRCGRCNGRKPSSSSFILFNNAKYAMIYRSNERKLIRNMP